MKITLKQLRVFVNAAKNNSLKQAAEYSCISQAAASMALLELERQLGLTLFDRVGKRLQLNDNGRSLLPKAVSTLDHASEIESYVDSHDGELAGSITIGASTSIGNYVLPKYIALFKMMYPNVYCRVYISNTEDVVNQVEAMSLDLGLIEGFCQSDKLFEKRWLKDEIKIICQAKHPLTKKSVVRLADLSHFPWVVREGGSGAREIFADALAHRLQLRKEVTLNSNEAIKNYVINSNCLAYVSHAVIGNEERARSLKVLSVRGVKIIRDFHQIVHKQKYQTELVKRFVAYLDEQVVS